MRTIPEIIALWPSRAELARRLGLEPIVVQRWHSRGRIPGEYDMALVKQAEADGIRLTFEDLATARAAAPSGDSPTPDQSPLREAS